MQDYINALFDGHGSHQQIMMADIDYEDLNSPTSVADTPSKTFEIKSTNDTNREPFLPTHREEVELPAIPDVATDLDESFSALSTRFEGLPLNDTERNVRLCEVSLDEDRTKDDDVDLPTNASSSLDCQSPPFRRNVIAVSETISDSSEPAAPDGNEPNRSAIQKFLVDYNPNAKRQVKSPAGHLRASPSKAIHEWEYLGEAGMRNNAGPSVMQMPRRRSARRRSQILEDQPPIQEVSTNPLWKRRLTNHRHQWRIRRQSTTKSQSKLAGREHRELTQQVQSLLTDFDYEARPMSVSINKSNSRTKYKIGGGTSIRIGEGGPVLTMKTYHGDIFILNQ